MKPQLRNRPKAGVEKAERRTRRRHSRRTPPTARLTLRLEGPVELAPRSGPARIPRDTVAEMLKRVSRLVRMSGEANITRIEGFVKLMNTLESE